MTEPMCPYFGKCGGCSFQNIDYAVQLENKKKILQQAINFNDVVVFFGKEYEYRNRMDFIFHKNGTGLREKGDWKKIIDIKECSISDKKINKILDEIRSFFKDSDYFDLQKHIGAFKYCVIRTAKDSSVSFVLNEDSSRLTEAGDKVREFAEKTSADNVVITYVPARTDESTSHEFFSVKGEDELTEEYLGKTFKYSVQGFYQNNHEMAEKMHFYVSNLLKKYETKNGMLLDLYGGVGTFGIMNSDLFKSVVTVESLKECTDSANKNIELNKTKNVRAITLDAKNIKKISVQSPLYVITDPPRSGMDERTISQLNMWRPKTIIYISCNVEQLKKDVPKFKGYSVKSAALFDLFPQTPHSEAVVELVIN